MNEEFKSRTRKKRFIGILIVLTGVFVIFFNYFLEKKDYAIEYMSEKIYMSSNQTPEEIDDNDDTSDVTEPEDEDEENSSKEEVVDDNSNDSNKINKTNKNNASNYYIGYLEIPGVNFKRGFVSMDSKDNVVSKNISIMSGSSYPDVDKGNFIIAGHSGTGIHSYFKNLYKLKTGAKVYVYYKNVKYTYKIVKIYKQEKKGIIAIYRDTSKTTLTLVTCTKNDKKHQTVYIAELEKKENY